MSCLKKVYIRPLKKMSFLKQKKKQPDRISTRLLRVKEQRIKQELGLEPS